MASDKERVKSYDGKAKWIYFLIGDYEILKNTIIFDIKSALMLRKNWIANLSTTEHFFKAKIKSYGDEPTNFHDRDKLQSHFFDSNHY